MLSKWFKAKSPSCKIFMDEQKEIQIKTKIMEYILNRFELKADIGLTEKDKAKDIACELFNMLSSYFTR